MADDNSYWGAVKDRVHDLAHHAVDTVSGAIAAATPPSKSPASEGPASDWVSRKQAMAQRDTNAGLDKQISDNE